MATIGHFEKLRALCGTTRLLITGGTRTGAASQIVIFDHVANKLRHTVDVPAHVLGLCLQGDHVLCAGADGSLRIYGLESGRSCARFRPTPGLAPPLRQVPRTASTLRGPMDAFGAGMKTARPWQSGRCRAAAAYHRRGSDWRVCGSRRR